MSKTMPEQVLPKSIEAIGWGRCHDNNRYFDWGRCCPHGHEGFKFYSFGYGGWDVSWFDYVKEPPEIV